MLLQKFSKNMPPSRIKRRKKKTTSNMTMEVTPREVTLREPNKALQK